jgi:hypothetical protein
MNGSDLDQIIAGVSLQLEVAEPLDEVHYLAAHSHGGMLFVVSFSKDGNGEAGVQVVDRIKQCCKLQYRIKQCWKLQYRMK